MHRGILKDIYYHKWVPEHAAFLDRYEAYHISFWLLDTLQQKLHRFMWE